MKYLKSFLYELFYELESNKLEYCLMGKAFTKFDDKKGDIDIIFEEKDLKKCLKIIFRLTNKENIYPN